jgi:transposase-like protein
LEAELEEHLAAEASAAGDAEGGPVANQRNGRRAKKVMTEVGEVRLTVPRDRAGTFTPEVIAKSKRRTTGIDEMVVSLTARGMTTGDIVAHLKDVFDIDTTKETVSTITDRVLEGMHEWRARPLDAVYPVVMIDAIHVKIRVLALILLRSQVASKIRLRSRSSLARPNIWRLSILMRLTVPSTAPEL